VICALALVELAQDTMGETPGLACAFNASARRRVGSGS
jgi:hypothetical protein